MPSHHDARQNLFPVCDCIAQHTAQQQLPDTLLACLTEKIPATAAVMQAGQWVLADCPAEARTGSVTAV